MASFSSTKTVVYNNFYVKYEGINHFELPYLSLTWVKLYLTSQNCLLAQGSRYISMGDTGLCEPETTGLRIITSIHEVTVFRPLHRK